MTHSAGKMAFPKRFKGDCRLCGKKGHKANDCWDNQKNKGKKPAFNIKKHQITTPIIKLSKN